MLTAIITGRSAMSARHCDREVQRALQDPVVDVQRPSAHEQRAIPPPRRALIASN